MLTFFTAGFDIKTVKQTFKTSETVKEITVFSIFFFTVDWSLYY